MWQMVVRKNVVEAQKFVRKNVMFSFYATIQQSESAIYQYINKLDVFL